jgi:transcriptional regulator with XRE-family HTH domain
MAYFILAGKRVYLPTPITKMTERIHHGQNIKRFREMLNLKQEALAHELGEDWTQKKISLLEAKETVEPEILDEVAKVLNIPVDAIKNFSEDAAVNIISTTFNDNSAVNYKPIFNPIDKLVEALDENKKLYTALLKEKDEKISLLERLLTEKR